MTTRRHTLVTWPNFDQVKDLPLNTLELPPSVYNPLRRNGINTLAQLKAHIEKWGDALWKPSVDGKIHGFGKKRWRILLAALAQHNVTITTHTTITQTVDRTIL